MKFIFNRFITVFVLAPLLIALVLIGTVTLYFIFHWIIFGVNFYEQWGDLLSYTKRKFPMWE